MNSAESALRKSWNTYLDALNKIIREHETALRKAQRVRKEAIAKATSERDGV